jgi:outer membrane protein TolC
MKKRIIYLLTILLPRCSCAQPIVSLFEIIKEAKSQSPQSKLETTRKELSYFNYLTYRTDFKPQISLYGNAPVFSKQYSPIIQPNGSISYLQIKQNLSSAGISLSQTIPYTGGQISFNSELNRFDDLLNKSYQYNGTPFFIQLNQPLFSTNSFKWSKKIEPLKLEESNKFYLLQLEAIAEQTCNLYFDVLEAQENIRTSELNFKNAEQNYAIEQKRVSLGTTTEDKLLQLELQLLSTKENIEKARYDYQIALLNLKSTLGRKDTTDLKLIIPDQLPVFDVNLDETIARAYKNRPEFVTQKRSMLEARRDVAMAKSEKQKINITATYGLNGANTQLKQVYSSPKGQQTFSIGFNIPIIDWGRRRINLSVAETNLKLIEYNNQIDENNYVQQLITLVKNIPILRNNIAVDQVRDSVALRRYTIANKLYQNGKLTITDLNIAEAEKDNSRKEYLGVLRTFWSTYFLLRKLTLYDFVNKTDL